MAWLKVGLPCRPAVKAASRPLMMEGSCKAKPAPGPRPSRVSTTLT
jgi:hypothetical protein